MTSPNDKTVDLDWLAFQYVTDELSAADAVDFENRLADDQEAREALAEAVLLSQALLAGVGETVAAAVRQSDWSGALVWAASGAAACLAVIVGGSLLSDPKPAVEARRHGSQSDNELAVVGEGELALAWANAFFPSASDDEARLDGLGIDDESSLAGEVEQGVSVPNWMVEAVRGFEAPGDAANEREES